MFSQASNFLRGALRHVNQTQTPLSIKGDTLIWRTNTNLKPQSNRPQSKLKIMCFNYVTVWELLHARIFSCFSDKDTSKAMLYQRILACHWTESTVLLEENFSRQYFSDWYLISSSVTINALQSGCEVLSHTPGFFSTAADSCPVMGMVLVCRALAMADRRVSSVQPGPTPARQRSDNQHCMTCSRSNRKHCLNVNGKAGGVI